MHDDSLHGRRTNKGHGGSRLCLCSAPARGRLGSSPATCPPQTAPGPAAGSAGLAWLQQQQQHASPLLCIISRHLPHAKLLQSAAGAAHQWTAIQRLPHAALGNRPHCSVLSQGTCAHNNQESMLAYLVQRFSLRGPPLLLVPQPDDDVLELEKVLGHRISSSSSIICACQPMPKVLLHWPRTEQRPATSAAAALSGGPTAQVSSASASQHAVKLGVTCFSHSMLLLYLVY